jgi:hypothetical protein
VANAVLIDSPFRDAAFSEVAAVGFQAFKLVFCKDEESPGARWVQAGCQVRSGPAMHQREHEHFSNQDLAVRIRLIAGRKTRHFERSTMPNRGTDSILKHLSGGRFAEEARK